MPSTSKTLYFLSSALVTCISVGILGFAMSTSWATKTMACDRGESGHFNGSAAVTLELFNGRLERTFCPLFGPPVNFQVFPKLAETKGIPVVLHGVSVCLLVLCLLCSAFSILISLYNSVSNPYETYMGPIGIYVTSAIGACLSVLVLIIFVSNITLTTVAEDLVRSFAEISVDLRIESFQMQLGYYLLIPYAVLSLLAIGLIYMYDHAAYTHRREQQRPTEDAPKEIMMY
ncbi:clarin-3 [Corythoichthys intestinalis]|uniref:clarin-3 n=1 Tax=Corythoichthys intestinalis TaxID=161448 RepID=UPI0025A5FA8D|nr:clarin-3 [Corythoichthys intestinalis]XP_061807206.1 clarin-3 [Nerophis lumbriciformis]